MRLSRRTAAILAVTLLFASAAGGYALGRDQASSTGQASAEHQAAAQEALLNSKRAAQSVAIKRGVTRGEKLGSKSGERNGSADGRRAGRADTQRELEQQEAPVPPSEHLVCDGAVADDAQYAACAAQSGTPIPQSESGDYGINPAEVCANDPALADQAGFAC
jgi:hypothetical protein